MNRSWPRIVIFAAWLAMLSVATPPPAPAEDDRPLTLTDLIAYRDALSPDETALVAPEPVVFLDLWEHPDQYRGRRVMIEGRAIRRFHQGKIGEYPALVELWIASPTSNLMCLVYPEPDGGDPTPLPSTVRFVGTFLKRVRYESSDVDRLAPLIVGPSSPEVLQGPAEGPWRVENGPFTGFDWLIGVLIAAMVVFAIVRQILRRPIRRPRIDDGPPPEFVEPDEAPA